MPASAVHLSSVRSELGAPNTVVLIGNANVGKSVIFSYLTGQYVTVSNYPGTTVEVARGKARDLGSIAHVIDTPGIQSLSPDSEDERVARDLLLDNPNAIVLLVADCKNVRRTLTLLASVLELGCPVVVALNMADEAAQCGVHVDADAFTAATGVTAIPTVAIERRGLDRIKKALRDPGVSRRPVTYPPRVEQAVESLTPYLSQSGDGARALALGLLAGDATLLDRLDGNLPNDFRERLRAERQVLKRVTGREPETVIRHARLAWVERTAPGLMRIESRRGERLSERLGRWSMHPVWGLPILAAVLYGVFWFVGILGAGTAVDFLENTVFNGYINPMMTAIVNYLPWAFLRELLVGEYGVITMALTYAFAIVLPVVGTFFIAFGVLEDSGYLPRLAVMVDRFFRAMGLNGRAVLPMVLGLGCDTMATLTTRILPSKKERIVVTLLLALGVPCSAQLGVILGMLAGLSISASLIWVGVVLGVLFSVGFLSSRLIPGERSDFILEIAPLRRPKIGNILSKTVARMEWYLKEAVPLFVYGTLLLFVLDKIGAVTVIERGSAPIIGGLLGLPEEATQSFI
ncbi:MAG TPA: ferrous iron transport protein B, partial [Acidobacteriota bacterium]|nr:ferrous iron transport protein B [Acidobacteriota bacterium]